MWLHYGVLALDLAQERTRELERAAARHRLMWELDGVRADPPPPRRPSGVRAVLARPVRIFSNVTHTVAEAACSAATRIEGRTA